MPVAQLVEQFICESPFFSRPSSRNTYSVADILRLIFTLDEYTIVYTIWGMSERYPLESAKKREAEEN